MPFAETLRRALTRRSEPRPLNRLELHVTHVCNLACESCSHYSNHNHHGHLALDEADRWMRGWSKRLALEEFHLLGGEPTIHPELTGFVRLVRRHWPETMIRIRTNGFFLNRHPELPALLAADRRTSVTVAIHHDSAEYRARLRETFALAERWQQEGIAIDFGDSVSNWTRRYHGFGATMQPFEDGAPRASWEICPARYCKQLFEGKIWKCAPLAYLKMQKDKYPLSSKWDLYLTYQPLDPDCGDRELDRFLATEDEPHCAMCAATSQPLALPIPLRSAAQAPAQ